MRWAAIACGLLISVMARATSTPEPVWQGWYTPGAPTELIFAAGLAPGVSVSVQSAGNPGYRAASAESNQLSGREGTPLGTPDRAGWAETVDSVAVGAADSRLQVALTGAAGKRLGTHEVVLRPRPALPLIAVVAGVDFSVAARTPPDWYPLFTAVGDLPRFAASYETIDLLALAEASLPKLTALQRRALQNHVANCGRVVVVGPGVPASGVADWGAGCGGRFFAYVAAGQVQPTVDALLARTPARLPGMRAVRQLLPETASEAAGTNVVGLQGIGTNVPGLIAVGWLLALGVAMGHKTPIAVLGVTAVAAAAMLALVTGVSSETRNVTWIEVSTAEKTGRGIAVTRVRAAGRGHEVLTLTEPAHLQAGMVPRPTTSATGELSLGLQGASLNWPARLGADQVFWRTGAATPSPLALLDQGGRPVIRNESDRAGPAATLAWNDSVYDLPVLGPGEAWSPVRGAGRPWSSSPSARLFRQRAMAHDVALLARERTADNSVFWMVTQ